MAISESVLIVFGEKLPLSPSTLDSALLLTKT